VGSRHGVADIAQGRQQQQASGRDVLARVIAPAIPAGRDNGSQAGNDVDRIGGHFAISTQSGEGAEANDPRDSDGSAELSRHPPQVIAIRLIQSSRRSGRLLVLGIQRRVPVPNQIAFLRQTRHFSGRCSLAHHMSRSGLNGIVPTIMIPNALLEAVCLPDIDGQVVTAVRLVPGRLLWGRAYS
jgi:hypothetical protein